MPAEAPAHVNPLLTLSSKTGVDTTSGGKHQGKTATPCLKVKHETLKDCANDPADPPRICRDLTQELNAEASDSNVARQDLADARKKEADHDEELLADPPPQARHTQGPTAPPAPPGSEGMDFWTRMEHMTTRQSNAVRQDINFVATHLDNKIMTGLHTLETKLTTDLRRLENATTKKADDISTLTKRVSELEMRPTPEAQTASNAAPSGGMLQNHVIVGGWPDAIAAAERIAIIQNAFASTPGLSEQALRPFAPRGSAILKIQFCTETVATSGSRSPRRPSLGNAPSWLHCGPPPPLRGPRRSPSDDEYVLMNATDSLKAMVGPEAAAMVRPDLRAGTICFNKLPVLEINADAYLDITALWAICPSRPHLAARQPR